MRGVMTQGRHAQVEQQWVTYYVVLYSADCDTWTNMYLGGTDEKTVVIKF